VSNEIDQIRRAWQNASINPAINPVAANFHRDLGVALDTIEQLLTDNMILADNRMDEYQENIKLTEKIERITAKASRLKAVIGDAICDLDDIPSTSGTSSDLENALMDSASGSPSPSEPGRVHDDECCYWTARQCDCAMAKH